MRLANVITTLPKSSRCSVSRSILFDKNVVTKLPNGDAFKTLHNERKARIKIGELIQRAGRSQDLVKRNTKSLHPLKNKKR